jgi:hypothetical protein
MNSMPNLIATFPNEPIGVWLAAAAFFAGGIANATGRPNIRATFIGLGFPGWWCRVTAALEILAALLMVVPASFFVGIGLGGCIMVVAVAAILVRRRYAHLPPPILFLFLLALAGFGHTA